MSDKLGKEFKRRNLHPYAQACVIYLAENHCPICDYPLDGKPFRRDFGNGFFEYFSESDAEVHFAHLTARSENGNNTIDNLVAMHKKCNVEMGNSSIEIHCFKVRTAKTARELRDRAALGAKMHSDAMENGIVNTEVLKIAKEILLSGKRQKIGDAWRDKILAA